MSSSSHEWMRGSMDKESWDKLPEDAQCRCGHPKSEHWRTIGCKYEQGRIQKGDVSKPVLCPCGNFEMEAVMDGQKH